MRMIQKFLLMGFFLMTFLPGQAQTEKVKVFLDCKTWCAIDYIRREITLVDYVNDRTVADVHVLVTEQSTGGGGSRFQLLFFGQQRFGHIQDTVRFYLPPNTTDFNGREVFNRNLKIGLLRFVAQTSWSALVDIRMKQPEMDTTTPDPTLTPTVDRWNYWVYKVRMNGNLNGDKVYKSFNYNFNLSANRITEELKLRFSAYANKNKTTYTYEDPNGVEPTFTFINNNHGYGFEHELVKSLTEHWSYGYNLNLSNSTFSNYQLQLTAGPAIEYNIFPYKESNNKLLTFRYGVDIRLNRYIDSTLYLKKKETLPGHWMAMNLSFQQKWGDASVGMNYHHYFAEHWKYYSLGMSGNVNVRITGGLSINGGMFAGLVRDQLSLSGKDVSQQDILTRRRQLASNYNYFTYFGLSYQFGSKLNNFVNPRFEGGNMSFFF